MKKSPVSLHLSHFFVSFGVAFSVLVLSMGVSSGAFLQASILAAAKTTTSAAAVKTTKAPAAKTSKSATTTTKTSKSSSSKTKTSKPAKPAADVTKLLQALAKADTKECQKADDLESDDSASEKNVEKAMKDCATSLNKIVLQLKKVGKKDSQLVETVKRGKELIKDIKANDLDVPLGDAIQEWKGQAVTKVNQVFVAPLAPLNTAPLSESEDGAAVGNTVVPGTSPKLTPDLQSALKKLGSPSVVPAPAKPLAAPAAGGGGGGPSAAPAASSSVAAPAVTAPAAKAPTSGLKNFFNAVEKAPVKTETSTPAVTKPATTTTPSTSTSSTTTSTPAASTPAASTPSSSSSPFGNMTDAQRQALFQSMSSGSGSRSGDFTAPNDAAASGFDIRGLNLSAYTSEKQGTVWPYFDKTNNATTIQKILNAGKLSSPTEYDTLTSNEQTGIEVLLQGRPVYIP